MRPQHESRWGRVTRLLPRTLADWTPDQGSEQDWLAMWAARGMLPEHSDGAWFKIGGRTVKRWALIEHAPQPSSEG